MKADLPKTRSAASVQFSRFRANRMAMISVWLLALIVALCFLGPFAFPFTAEDADFDNISAGVDLFSIHPFGTDEMGNDILSRVIVGTRTSLWIGLVITGVAVLIGVPLGIFAGYAGGRTREAIMRITDVFLSVPGLALALAIVASLGPGIANCVIALSLVWWPGYVRLIESKTLALKEELFVEAARAVGASTPYILYRHILPNCVSPLIVKASMDFGLAILAAASLGFIGLGARAPAPEWGSMISVARSYMPDWWWYALFPGLAIYLTVLGFNLFGDGLRDILDPKSRGR